MGQIDFIFHLNASETDKYFVRQINYEDTKDLILNVHYAKRMPSISYAYGLFEDGNLVGLVSYGVPASPRVCEGLCGKEHSKRVLELNRLVLRNNKKNEASILVSKSLKLLPKPSIVISYADTSQNHVGYIYQATNFFYLGLSAKRTDRVFVNGEKSKHGRHMISTDIEDIKEKTVLVDRPRKHRYLHIMASKKDKKKLLKQLKYQIKPYPKGEKNEN
tara:strand:- start:712 stop:1365 length:654 start_codon:yes stop_codon:yes gene_type:complete